MADVDYDAIIIGAGFAGIYQLHSLRSLGLRCLVIDQAGDVGGTWYWNRYPGAMSDTESYIYRFSWDKEDLKTYPWKDHYVKQPEVLAYLNHVVKRHNLRKDMCFHTQMRGATWNADTTTWDLDLASTSIPETTSSLRSRYLITALGLLSAVNYPSIPGLSSFAGARHHTAAWPASLDLTGKRVGIVGCGSTGVQVITAIAPVVAHLTCFQRHPQYSVPSGDRPVEAEYRAWVNEHYDEIWDGVRNSKTAFGFEESEVRYGDVTPQEREHVFEEAWQKGNGFRFMMGTFVDVTTDWEANEGACEFIRRKIDGIVKDPEKARRLKPYDIYARRPLCDGVSGGAGGYYEQFNRENVEIVDLKETPIERISEKGVVTGDGKEHEVDVLVFATGFDAVEGNYTRLSIKGREGRSLADAWGDEMGGPNSYMGVTVPGFPNLFLISGPKGPFSNMPPGIEAQVEWITRAIGNAESKGAGKINGVDGDAKTNPMVIEATDEAEREWARLCEEAAKGSLFWEAEDNWIFGANIPGKKRCLRFYFAGMKAYREQLKKCEENEYTGFLAPFGTPLVTTKEP